MDKKVLIYDTNKWEEKISKPVNTLQLFITEKCNLRCKGCFVGHKLGSHDMEYDVYRFHILNYCNEIQKVILLGGEPTLHKNLLNMINLNEELNLKTTVYTNGIKLDRLDREDWYNTEVRVGVYGAYRSEKPLVNIPKVERPITIVYMLRRDNIDELFLTAKMAEEYNCNRFYISSIRDITKTHDYWLDTEETIPPFEYADIVQNFINNYNGNIKEIHISKRGVLETSNSYNIDVCRFGNIFLDNEKIICPLDISNKILSNKLEFSSRKCNKRGCILQKIVLKRK